MTSKTSSNNRLAEFCSVYRWSLKKNRGMGALLTVLLFLSLPLIPLLSLQQKAEEWAKYPDIDKTHLSRELYLSRYMDSFLHSTSFLVICIILLFAIILCVLLFNYMHGKRSVDLFHALPVGRTPMLLGRWCAGLTILYIPLVLNTAILEIIRLAWGISYMNGSPSIWTQMFIVILMGTAAFTFSMFMAVCSGTTLDTVLSILGVNAGYPILILCGVTVMNLTLPGFDFNWRNGLTLITALAPFPAAVVAFTGSRSTGFLVWWIVMTILILAGSVVLYRKRKSECAENNFAFPIPKIIIRFILTAVGGIGLGLFLNTNIRGGFFIGLAAGSALVHVIVEAIYSRGFAHIKKSFKWYGTFAAAFAVFYGIVATGGLGYDTRIPNAADVASVTIDSGYSFVDGSGCTVIYDENGNSPKQIKPVVFNQAGIQAAIDMQKTFIDSYRTGAYPYRIGNSVGSSIPLTYHLKNGKVISRTYNLFDGDGSADWDKFSAIQKKVTENPEFAKGTDMIFHVGAADVKSVDVGQGNGENQMSYVPNEDVKQKLLDAIQQDILNHKSDQGNNTHITVQVNFKDSLTPRDEFVKYQLPSGQTKFRLNGGGRYSVHDKNSETYRLAQQMGWIS